MGSSAGGRHGHRGGREGAACARPRREADQHRIHHRRDSVRRAVLPRARPRLAGGIRGPLSRGRRDPPRGRRLAIAHREWSGDDARRQDGGLVAGDRQPHAARSLRERAAGPPLRGREASDLWQAQGGLGGRPGRHGDPPREHRRPLLRRRRDAVAGRGLPGRDRHPHHHAPRLGADHPPRVREVDAPAGRSQGRQAPRDLCGEEQRALWLPVLRRGLRGDRRSSTRTWRRTSRSWTPSRSG